MITERQEKLLSFLVKDYLESSEPVSSKRLKKSAALAVSEATVRNDLQVLAEEGYITQPHTSAGRVPTEKAYKYFAHKLEQERESQFDDFIVPACRQAGDKSDLSRFIAQQIEFAHRQMERQMQMMEELMQTLEQKDDLFEILNILDKWHKKI